MMHGWYGGGLGWIGMIIGLIFTLAVIVGVILLVVWLVRRGGSAASGYNAPSAVNRENVKDILQLRYAKGEITREQYQQMLADLDQGNIKP